MKLECDSSSPLVALHLGESWRQTTVWLCHWLIVLCLAQQIPMKDYYYASSSIEIQYQVGKSKFTRQIDLKNSTNKRGKRRNKKDRTKMVPMLLPLSANGKVLKALSRVVRDFRPDLRPATPHIPCSPKALSYFDYCMLIIYNFPLTTCTWFTGHTIMSWISLSRGCSERKMIYNRHI